MIGKRICQGLVISLGISISSMFLSPGLIYQKVLAAEEQVIKEYNLEKLIQEEPGIKEFMPLMKENAQKYKSEYISEADLIALVVALLKAETGSFDPRAISPAGAGGLVQLIPETAVKYKIKAYNPEYLHQARADIRMSYFYQNKYEKEINNPGEDGIYIIKQGDTLCKIADKENKSLSEILEANPHLKGKTTDGKNKADEIRKGDRLIIPGSYSESTKKMLEYKREYHKYKNKANEGFKRYAKEVEAMIDGKTEEELMNIDQRFVVSIAMDFCFKHTVELVNARKGDIREAVSAYNAGLHRVEQYKGIPPFNETVKYQNKIINFFRGYKALMKR